MREKVIVTEVTTKVRNLTFYKIGEYGLANKYLVFPLSLLEFLSSLVVAMLEFLSSLVVVTTHVLSRNWVRCRTVMVMVAYYVIYYSANFLHWARRIRSRVTARCILIAWSVGITRLIAWSVGITRIVVGV
jgi:hypothetical protein